MLEEQILTVGKVIEWFSFVLSYVSIQVYIIELWNIFILFTSVLGANWQKKNSKSNILLPC